MCNGCLFVSYCWYEWCWCDISFYLNSSNSFDCVQMKQRFDQRNFRFKLAIDLCLVDFVPICWYFLVCLFKSCLIRIQLQERQKKKQWKTRRKKRKMRRRREMIWQKWPYLWIYQCKIDCKWSNLLSTHSCQHIFFLAWIQRYWLCFYFLLTLYGYKSDIRLKTPKILLKLFIYCESYSKVVPQYGI